MAASYVRYVGIDYSFGIPGNNHLFTENLLKEMDKPELSMVPCFEAGPEPAKGWNLDLLVYLIVPLAVSYSGSTRCE
jgi:hypothetical protein